MKITPYLLALNGFQVVENTDTHYWRRMETYKPGNSWGEWQFIIDITPGNKCGEFVPVKYEAIGVWNVSVAAPGLYMHIHIKDFYDLIAISEVIARNQHGFENIPSVEIHVPEIYVENNWERGEFDQSHWDDRSYSYIPDNISKCVEVMVPGSSCGHIPLKTLKTY